MQWKYLLISTTLCFYICLYGVGTTVAANEENGLNTLGRSKRYAKGNGWCEPLAPPKRGSISCSALGNKMTCTAACMPGFKFPDETSVKKHVCNNHDGTWMPDSRISDCQPVCDPPCEHSGQCFGNNQCVCTTHYRGERCEFPISNCAGYKLHGTGGYACNHTNEETICLVSCPLGMEFDYPPASVYTCDVHGNWLPKYVPKCIPVNVKVHTLQSVAMERPGISKLLSLDKKSVCSTWGQLHYRTFDGTLYSAQGQQCTYLLAKDCSANTFNIHVQDDRNCTNVLNCIRRIAIYINHDKYFLDATVDGPTVYWGGNRLRIPSLVNGVLFEEVSHYIVVQSGVGFTLRWNGQSDISVEIGSELYNKTCGLCGRMNGNPSDDFELLDGMVTNNSLNMLNSWKMTDFGDSCSDNGNFGNLCAYGSVEGKLVSEKASEKCGHIFLPEYSACHILIDAQPYYEMCRLDFCTCGSEGDVCMCSSLSKYFQECFRLGGKLAGGWRKEHFCSFDCPGDMIYQDCGSSCPRTCKKILLDCYDEQCVDGCHCPTGTVHHEGRCIKATECPCHHAGKTFDNGESIQRDCNKCICYNGSWQCTKEKCEARCSAVGDPHYTTFDGKHYNFMGKCSYYLMYNDNYTIEQENVACSGAISESMGFVISPSSDYPSCTKSVVIRISGTVVHLKQRKEVVINGKEIEQLPVAADGVYVYTASSIYMKVELGNGLTVTWDGISRVYIDAPASFLDRTKGLCGTLNYNQKDDFLTNEEDIEQDVNAFANKWKATESCHDVAFGETLRDPCELFSQRREKSQLLCGRLKSDIFAKCHDVVDPEPFFKDCVYDMCYCQNKVMSCLCPAIADYAAVCAKENVLVDWRASVRECGINCPRGQVYQICSSSCKRSCTDISYHPNCREQCIEGCNCPPGMTLNPQGECILISSCPCMHGGNKYLPGYKDIRGNTTCECSFAKWECRAATDEEMLAHDKDETEVKTTCSAAANMEYTSCAAECPTTCLNMHSPPKCESLICKPGCVCGPLKFSSTGDGRLSEWPVSGPKSVIFGLGFLTNHALCSHLYCLCAEDYQCMSPFCKKGYVLNTKTGRCVKPTNCPCHHGGQSYSEGEMIQEDCNTCVCEGGIWSCEKKECPGMCKSWGNSHFKTFDGHLFEFHGDCDYILARGGQDKWDKFYAIIHNVLCGTSDITCSKSVTFSVGGEKVTLSAANPIPKNIYNERYIVRDVGRYVFIHTDIGITLQWDRGTMVYLRMDVKWKDKVEGLCGNFNDNENDDFKTSDGGPPVAKATVFGDSWRVHDYCPLSKAVNDTCDIHPHRKSWATQECSILKSATFKPCHSEVPYEPYLERCIFDACGCDVGGDCECMCTALTAYAQECNIHGIAITWRSKDLCPIQCKTCETYTPCMSVCPQLTCKTQYLYTSIEGTCGREVCVEGCESKPCPADQMFNNDEEFKCIPKSGCVAQPCRVINGEMYYEGEQIKDPDVADLCQSCHCRAGDIICVGQKCAPAPKRFKEFELALPNSTSTRGTASCEKDGWTEWMNGFSPTYKNGGDFETFELLRKRLFTFCPVKNMRHIECRAAGTHKPYKETGQNVWCSLPEGLICENKDQPVIKLCNDFEIRVYCDCGFATSSMPSTTLPTLLITETTLPPITCTAPGWTKWMNSVKPTGEGGDYEIIPELRKQFSFCLDNEIEYVECRAAVPSVNGEEPTVYSNGVECTKDRGLVCRNSANATCADYEVRFYCHCEADCADARGMQSGEIADRQIVVSSYLTPETMGMKGRLQGDGAWTAGSSDKDQWIQVDLSDEEELTGIIIQGNPSHDEWVSLYKVAYSKDGQHWDYIRNIQAHHEVFFGNSDRHSAVKNMFDTQLVARYIRLIPLEWKNRISLRLELLGCNRFLPTTTTTSTVTRREQTQTTEMTTIVTSTKGTPFPFVCIRNGWTEWMNIDSPATVHLYEVESNNLGDFEPVTQLRYFYSFCANPETVECRVVNTRTMAHLTGQKVKCDLDGLQCRHDSQNEGDKCLDYEIRFYCQCEETTTTTQTEVTSTMVPTSETEAEWEHVTPCPSNYRDWTDWMNSNDPTENIEGDFESRNTLHREYKFCDDEYTVDIECREIGSNVTFSSAGQYGVVCDLNHGLKCLHSMQPSGKCKDYEVRFYCLCKTYDFDAIPKGFDHITEAFEYSKVPTVTLSYVTEQGVIPACNAWTDWMNQDTPADDGNDHEAPWMIPNYQKLCPKPVSFQCREARTKQPFYQSGQNFKERCNSNGIVCESVGQTCKDYEIRVFCLCPTSPPQTVTDCVPGWTDWFDTHDPHKGEGDFEQIEDIRKTYEICSSEFITDIECQARSFSVGVKQAGMLLGKVLKNSKSADEISAKGFAKSFVKASSGIAKAFSNWLDYTETGDIGVKCSVTTGLACYNALQAKKRTCRDYRVRFYCSCGSYTQRRITTTTPVTPVNLITTTTTTTITPLTVGPESFTTASESHCGWTLWMNLGKPDLYGEFEMIEKLQEKYKICNRFDMKRIECRLADSKTPWDTAGQHGVTCDLENGLRCENRLQTEGCYDYEVTILCLPPWCERTTSVLLTEMTTTTIATPPCMPGTSWSECAHSCDRMCQSFLKHATATGLCGSEYNKTCIPGCISNECLPPYVWRDEIACVQPEYCTCYTDDGQLVSPGAVLEIDECEKCQCISNVLECVETPDCDIAYGRSEDINFTAVKQKKKIQKKKYHGPAPGILLANIEQPDCWTSWINIDSPHSSSDDIGDIEDMASIRKEYSFCAEPVRIECRVAETNQSSVEVGQTVECDWHVGFRCYNQMNWERQGCLDYKVRFFCPCENATTQPFEIETTTIKTEVTGSACVTQGYTDWFSAHSPTSVEEYENVQDIRSAGYSFCRNEFITAIECRVKGAEIPHYKSRDTLVICNLMEGLSCDSRKQDRICEDYEVRFYCECGVSSTTSEETTTTTEQTTATPIQTTTVETVRPPCSYWSNWINNDKPWFGIGDVEILRQPTSFCKDGEIRDIECVLEDLNVNYRETKERHLECSVQKGFVCKNKYQPDKLCHDYKIRYFCGCAELPVTSEATTTTTLAPTTTILIVPRPSLSPTVPMCESYDYILNEISPVQDSQFAASSSLSSGAGPQHARLSTLRNQSIGEGWTAAVKDFNQYIQVDLGTAQTVFGIATQGNGLTPAWVSSYKVLFGTDGSTFSYASGANEIPATFKGNYDNVNVVKNMFEKPFVAQFVRIVPLSWEGLISLRFDLIGCNAYVTSPPTTTTQPTTTTEIYTTTASHVCKEKMGVENGLLADAQITASSSYDRTQLPHRARLNSEGNWSPKTSDKMQYLQFDLMGARVVTGVATQGRDGVPQWVTSYYIAYSTDGLGWSNITDQTGQSQVYAGNYDGNTVVTNYFDRPVRARYLTIVPQSWHNWIAMRVELVGCFEPYPTVEPPSIPCDDPMGMENGKIVDDMIFVTSSLAGRDTGGSRARLNTLESGTLSGGWVAASTSDQYIEIDFGEVRNLTGVITQGRDQRNEWVIRYRILYSNSSDKEWIAATDENGNEVFAGNVDDSNPVAHLFGAVFSTRYLRVVPTDWNRWISMRLEIVGCYEPYNFTKTTTSECADRMNGNISSSRIEVSSSLDGERSGAKRLSLNTLESEDTGGWIAGQSNARQYVLIDYGASVNITGIVTQGRNKHPEWVTFYKVAYSINKRDWSNATDEQGNVVIRGNSDSDSLVENRFEPTIVARYMKVMPLKWKDWISMRLEILGCSPNPEISRAIEASADRKAYCYSNGPWMSSNVPTPSSDGDSEPIGQLIAKTQLCLNPIRIECREAVTQKPYDQVGQNVSCDLTNGLLCRHADQDGDRDKCYNYEARIVCWTCGGTTYTVPPAVNVCPEVPIYKVSSCPDSCPHGFLCNGENCVDPSNCPCLHNGKQYHPGERFMTSDCKECVCKLNGHSYCVNKVCPECVYGREGTLNGDCDCECKTCSEDEIMCPTNQHCVHRHLWCDGVVDCPDDEQHCGHLVSSPQPTTTIKTCQPAIAPSCPPGTILLLKHDTEPCPAYECDPIPTVPSTMQQLVSKDSCEMRSSYFKTFDGYGYKYEICNHVLIQDKIDRNFSVTISKNCSYVTGQCPRYVTIRQDDHVLLLDSNLRVTYDGVRYTDTQLAKLGRKRRALVAKVVGDSVIVTSTKYDFEVIWNTEQNVRITTSPDSMSRVNGLCGTYNNDPDDDRETQDGQQALTETEFGDSWSVVSSSSSSSSSKKCYSQVCPADAVEKATAACNELKMPPFDACHDVVDPDYYIQICVESICECLSNTNHTEKECHCKAYLPYVESCEMKGVVKIRYWRVKQSCLPNCPPGLVWLDCGSDCERTCDSLQEYKQRNDTCTSGQCLPGCYCPVGLVRKGAHCVEPEKCHDCVCKGFGDPHYFTFDGQYYPFQGNCTYTLARDIAVEGQQHKFEVLATNEDCHEEPLTTCTVAVIILFGGHMAHFRVNESITFDGVRLKYSDLPFHASGIHIESIPGRSVTFTVPEVYLEVRYFELNYGFEVRIPSEVYYNKTEGLCGNCNFNESDDFRCRDGRATNDTDEFGFSWITTPPEGFESANDICKIKVDVGCKSHSVEQASCDRILSEEFRACHVLVDPDAYISACRFDVCRSVNPTSSLCRAMTAYTRKCADVGICIQNWRSKDFCHHECPPNMYFDQCGPACPKSCKDVDVRGWSNNSLSHGKDIQHQEIDPALLQTMQELDDVCDTTPVDGCFCIGGKVFLDGQCVDPIFCETCDDEGHKVGDTWKTDPCTVCHCTMKRTMQCIKTQCPTKPTCKKFEKLQVVVAANNDTCCETYKCASTMAELKCPAADLPTCRTGETIKTSSNEEGCPQYICECDRSVCPPVHTPTELQVGEETSIDVSGCCPVLVTVCRPDKCPEKPVCGTNNEIKERSNAKSRCCKEYYCEAAPNICLFSHEYILVNGTQLKLEPGTFTDNKLYKPGDTWMDGLCRNCTCESNNGQYRHHCTIELCPKLDDYEDRDDYHWHVEQMPGVCCPRYSRVLCSVNGRNYSIGEEWPSPDADTCKRYRCGTLKRGEVIKVEQKIKCLKNCEPGYEYFEPINKSECCGKCEPVACVEEGRLYNVGQTWNSTSHTCATAECIRLAGTIKTRYSGKVCRGISEDCTKKVLDSSGCCEICNETAMIPSHHVCMPQKMKGNQTIGMFELIHKSVRCRNSKPIADVTACVGYCESTAVYNTGQKDFVSSCRCCSPKRTENKTILIDCSDGNKRPIEYSQPTECDCSLCGSSSSGSSVSKSKYSLKTKG